MNKLLPKTRENASLTMSSREIAELVENRHTVVCRSIERLIENSVIRGYAPMVYTHPQNGQTYKEYLLEKRDTYIVVAQLSPEFTARLVDRWQELENQIQQPQLPQSYEQALEHLLIQVKENKALSLENKEQKALIELQAPKVHFADSVSASKTSILIGELATLITQSGYKIGQNKLFEWLRENGYLIKRKGSSYNLPTQYSIDLSLIEVKESTRQDSDGFPVIQKTPKITGKGQAYFINKFSEFLSEVA
ncbi:Uncharacterized phage-encoded protein [Phocoenobacter uteri]|uniref:Uncharacterized phage-encoded protein n=1 Tax=Phocoenobacter uteri TaxID=146806 RepID=A0A379C9L2_9PAST|nr:phage regulatory protein/antirepressor Ant [Phocoenobacter uteri]MDG6880966.1 hypothetical protein [Phocoenobacter uteri]SUB58983.1 Uncharacterized phage-encoded protein [Phocoenobacter uteri]